MSEVTWERCTMIPNKWGPQSCFYLSHLQINPPDTWQGFVPGCCSCVWSNPNNLQFLHRLTSLESNSILAKLPPFFCWPIIFNTPCYSVEQLKCFDNLQRMYLSPRWRPPWRPEKQLLYLLDMLERQLKTSKHPVVRSPHVQHTDRMISLGF